MGWSPGRALVLHPTTVDSTPMLVTLLATMDGLHTTAELLPLAERAGFGAQALSGLLEDLTGHGLLHLAPPPGTGHRPPVLLHGRGPLTDALDALLPSSGVTVHRSTRRSLSLPEGGVELVVLTDTLVHEPRLVSTLVADGLPHLVVRMRDGVGLVGPLVLPGRTGCLRCADRHRCDRDPEWPLLAAQLVGRCGAAGAAATRATAALAATQVQLLLADDTTSLLTGAPPSLGATLELDLTGCTLSRRPWPAHPGCGCGAHP
ncbi:MAG: TOMM precursor leader peptide-binding protein [Mycobacteriaceae bacterium]